MPPDPPPPPPAPPPPEVAAGAPGDPDAGRRRAGWLEAAWLRGPWAGGLLFLFLVATALLVYNQALGVPLGSDARFLTYQNDWVAAPDGITRFWTADFFEGARTHAFPYISGYYRPITNSLFWLEYRWAGTTDLLYNLGEVLLHGLNAFLVFLVVGRLLEDRLAGALAALLFVVHPVHAMAATEPAARGDLLFATFYLLGLWVFDGGLRGMAGAAGDGMEAGRSAAARARGLSGGRERAVGSPSNGGARGVEGGTRGVGMAWRAWVAAGLYALSLLSKEMAATFPAVLVLLVLYRRFRDGAPWRTLVWTLPAWGVFGAYLVWRFAVLDLVTPDLGYADSHASYAVLLAALKTIPVHLSRILVPLGATYPELNPELVNFVAEPLAQPLTWAALLVVAGLVGTALLWRRHPALALWAAFFLVTTTPLLRVDDIAGSLGRDVVLTQERWIYLPAVGVIALLGLGAARLLRSARERRHRVAVAAGIGGLALLLGTSAATHAGQHESPFAQLRRLYLIPEDRLGPLRLANKRLLYANWVALPMGDVGEAARRAREALALAPHSPIVAYSVANVLAAADEWAAVARVLEPWRAPSPERLRAHAREYPRVYDDLNRINGPIAYLLGRARAHLGEGSEGAGLLCRALRTGIPEGEVAGALEELWAYAGPPRCSDSDDPGACAGRAPDPPSALRAPLDTASCPGEWEAAVGERDEAP